MEPKVWMPLIILAALVGGTFGFRHLDMVDKANADLLSSRSTLEGAQQNLQARKTQWDSISATLGAARAKFADAQAKEAKAKATTEEANTLQRKVEADIKYLANSLPSQVEKIKTSDLNSVLQALTLNDGKRLANAQIKKIEENGITFIHADGSGVVPLDKLPSDLVEKYDLSPTGLVKTAKELETLFKEITAPPVVGKPSRVSTPRQVTSAPSPTPAPADPSVATKMSKDQENLKSVQLKMADMLAQINAAARIADQWAANADNAEERVSASRSRGAAPSGQAIADAKNARAQYSVAQARFTALEAEYRKLQVEEAHLKELLNSRR